MRGWYEKTNVLSRPCSFYCEFRLFAGYNTMGKVSRYFQFPIWFSALPEMVKEDWLMAWWVEITDYMLFPETTGNNIYVYNATNGDSVGT
jgi:hypothetical protein